MNHPHEREWTDEERDEFYAHRDAEAETRKRILEEVQRLRSEMQHCAHCAALRSQAVELMGLLPPDPILTAAERANTLIQAMQTASEFAKLTKDGGK